MTCYRLVFLVLIDIFQYCALHKNEALFEHTMTEMSFSKYLYHCTRTIAHSMILSFCCCCLKKNLLDTFSFQAGKHTCCPHARKIRDDTATHLLFCHRNKALSSELESQKGGDRIVPQFSRSLRLEILSGT